MCRINSTFKKDGKNSESMFKLLFPRTVCSMQYKIKRSTKVCLVAWRNKVSIKSVNKSKDLKLYLWKFLKT